MSALDESKLSDLISDLETSHVADISLSAAASAISSLWDMVIELRAQLDEAEKRGRQVKPLVWETDAVGQKWATAFGIKDFYGICSGMVYLRGHSDSTINPSENGVYADYEARIRSCLIDALSDEYTRGRIAGLNEAAVIADQWATDTQRIYGNGGPAAAIRALISQAKGEHE